MMTEEREERFKTVVANRQPNLTVVLENVHDTHNIAAVLRTCDSVGVNEIYVLNTDPRLQNEKLYISKLVSSGANKWVDIHYYLDAEKCYLAVKNKFDKLYTTHLEGDPKDLYELDLSASVALIFGNEKDGVSDTALQYSDGNFLIPQVGFVQSLNISVACAVTLYEAYRQRKAKGFYDENLQMTDVAQKELLKEFSSRQLSRENRDRFKQAD